MNKDKARIRKKRLAKRICCKRRIKKKIKRIPTNARWRLRRIIASKINIFEKILSAIERLGRANKTVGGFLSDAQERVKINVLIKRIQINILFNKLRLWPADCFDFQYFDEVYKIFVERKRRKMRADADMLERKSIEYMQGRQNEGLSHTTLPLGRYMKKGILTTYYAFLRNDDAYQQKAFLEFLKKKTENGQDCLAIAAYMEKKYKQSSYEEYKETIGDERYREYTGGALKLGIPELWLEFFQTGDGYEDIIPYERPCVEYWCTAKEDIPRFIFERPYVKEFSKQKGFSENGTRCMVTVNMTREKVLMVRLTIHITIIIGMN